MGSGAKIFLYFVLLTVAETAKYLDDYPLTTSCYVHYLHKKGKLNEPLPSTVQLPSRCRLVNSCFMEIAINEFTKPFSPKVAECLINTTYVGELMDYFLKVNVLTGNSFFDGAESQIEETQRLIQDVQLKISQKCIFNVTDPYHIPNLEDYQRLYCLQKYALDNKLSGVNNPQGDMNTDYIDTENVDCTNIVAVERIKTETLLRDKVGASQCEINELRIANLFDIKVNLGGELLEKFLGMPASECFE